MFVRGEMFEFRVGLMVGKARVNDVFGMLGVFSEFRAFGVLGEFRELGVLSMFSEFGLLDFAFGLGPLAGALNRWILVGHSAHCDRLASSATHLPDLQWRHRPEFPSTPARANEVADVTRPYARAPGTG